MNQTSSRRVFIDALNNLAAGVAENAGFGLVTISVAMDHTMQTLAVAGNAQDTHTHMGRILDISEVEKTLANADHRDELRFVPHRRAGTVPPPRTDPDENSWHPLDVVVAPIYDDQATLRGIISADLPRDGRRPSQQSINALQHFVVQTRRTILYALERLELDAQITMTEAVRRVVREASAELSVDRIITYCQEALTDTFDASGLWLQTFDDGQDANGAIFSTNGVVIHLKEDLRRVARPAAHWLWDAQQVAEIAETSPRTEAMTPAQEKEVFAFMRMIDISSMLFVPLGAGRECLGNLVLTRQSDTRPWTDLEKRTALDIGHDLGRALLNARSFERERHLVEELRELDSYKSRLIATLAHELKNPLTAILGHTEILEATPELPASALASVASVDRGAARMQRLVEDLLALGKAGDPQVPFEPSAFDLRAGIDDVLDLLRVTIDRKNLTVTVTGPDEPVLALGERAGLEQVLANLISNATKYTPEGGRVTISLNRSHSSTSTTPTVTLAVADNGIGISRTDQANLFTEFFRSTNPSAVAQPGTGLGLAIAQRIVKRHSGELDCVSRLGAGTTFTVSLPGA